MIEKPKQAWGHGSSNKVVVRQARGFPEAMKNSHTQRHTLHKVGGKLLGVCWSVNIVKLVSPGPARGLASG